MASLFDLLGLNSASGMPSSMSDEEQAAMLQNGGTGMSALLGLSPDVLTNAYGTPSTQAKQDAVQSAEQNAAAQNQAQAASTAQDNSQETQPAPQAQSDTDNSPAPTTNTDTPIAQASGQPDVSVDSASDDSTNSGGSNSTNSDSSFTPSSGLLAPSSSGSDSSSTTDSSPGFLSKLLPLTRTCSRRLWLLVQVCWLIVTTVLLVGLL
jgi:cytoskeletal protein RodZ